MGNPLFGVNISKLIHDNTKGQLLDATLHVRASGVRTGNLTGGTNPTFTDKTAEGFIDSKDIEKVGGTLVADGDVIVVLIGDSIEDGAVPTTADKVTIESTKYNITDLDRDPAAATYTLLCNKA